MKMQKELTSATFIKQYFKYFIFSGTAAITNIVSRYFLSTIANLNFYLAVIIAYSIGMVINFTLNRNLNFPKGPRHYIQEMWSFIIVALIGLLLTNLFSGFFLFLYNMFLNLDRNILETASHISAVSLVSIYSFFAHKYFTFRKGIIYEIKQVTNQYVPNQL